MLRRKKNVNEKFFDLTGASDIIFTLLLFYILTQNFLPSLTLSLPEIQSNSPKSELSTNVVLEKDGTILINNTKSNLDSFKRDISLIAKTSSATVNILADKASPAGNVVKIFDILQSLNILNISFQGKPTVTK